MAKNHILKSGTAKAVDVQIDRILSDLGNPEPPLKLEDAMELLRLDLGYYSTTDHTWLRQQVKKMKVGGKQVLRRPSFLFEAIRDLNLKALLLPDQKRILINKELPLPKHRWSKAHEIAHQVIPWHEDLTLGDQQETLSLDCHAQIEAEANYGAGRLLFLGNRIITEVRDHKVIDFNLVKSLKDVYGNTLTTTLWRIVENADFPAFGMVSKDPRKMYSEGVEPIRYFVRSNKFCEQFKTVADSDVFQDLGSFCYRKRGPLGEGTLILTDCNGQEHEFYTECFSNSYDVLTLGTYQGVRATSVAFVDI